MLFIDGQSLTDVVIPVSPMLQWTITPATKGMLALAHQNVGTWLRIDKTFTDLYRHYCVVMHNLVHECELVVPEIASNIMDQLLQTGDSMQARAAMYRLGCHALRFSACLPLCTRPTCLNCVMSDPELPDNTALASMELIRVSDGPTCTHNK